jgi:S1-C subfamily serine protease
MSNVDEPASPEPLPHAPAGNEPESPSHPVAPTVPMAHAPAPPPAPSGAFAPPPAGATPPPPPPPPPPPARARRQPRSKALTALAVAGFLTLSGVLGYTVGNNHGSSSSSANTSSIAVVPSIQGSQLPTAGQQGNGNGNNSSLDAAAVAAKVTPGVVNITTTLSGGEAAGTGIVISSNGLVLTNNHVIADSTEVNVAIGGNDNNTHPAKVLGYDLADDVALIQIQGVSGLQTAPLGSSSTLSVGDAIVAIGNAGGKGGTPSVVTGNVTALHQQITASDQDGRNPETLSSLVQVDADIQPGDSGGPLVDANAKVVGMDAAASSSNGGFGFGQFNDGSGSAAQGYAIPIENALAIAKKIAAGDGGNNIHIGGNRGVLGVNVQDNSTSSSSSSGNGFGGSGNGNRSNSDNGSSGSGADVVGVQSGSGAESAGIQQGDVIVSLNGNTVTSASQLTHALVSYSPKDKVTIEWTDSSGGNHQASIVLGSGPPA